MKAPVTALVAAAIASLLSAKSQAEVMAQLASYSLAPDVAQCPDEAVFRLAVRERLGREAFVSEAARVVEVSIRRRAGWFVLELSIDGSTRSVRARRCEDAVRAASLTVAIALDPDTALGISARSAPLATRGPRASSVTEAPPVMPPGFRESPEARVIASDPERAPRVVLWDPAWRPANEGDLRATEVSFSMGARVGLAPGFGETLARAGFSLAVGLRRGPWVASIETIVDLPGSARDAARRASIEATLWTGSASLCRVAMARSIAPFVCARATGGAVFARGNGYVVDTATVLPVALAGFRVGLDVGLSRAWAVRFGADADVAILRPAFTVDGGDATPAFRSPLGSFGLWFGARMWL